MSMGWPLEVTLLGKKMIKELVKEIVKKFEFISEEKKLMNINHWLAKKETLTWIGIVFWITLFLLFNFILNFIMDMGSIFKIGSESGNSTNLLFIMVLCLFKIRLKNIGLYLIIGLFDAIITLIFLYKVYISNKDYNIGQKGKERFSTLQEIQTEYRCVPIKRDIVLGTGGIPVAYHDENFYIDDGPVNNIVLAMTRGGKDQVIALPMLSIYCRAETKSSVLINDVKLDMYTKYHDEYEKGGFIVLCLNLVECLKSIQFNILNEVINYFDEGEREKGEELAVSIGYSIYEPDKQIGNEKYFAQASMDLLAAFIIAITTDCIETNQREKINIYSIIVLFSELYNSNFYDDKGEYHDFVREYFVTRPALDQAKLKFLTSEVASSRSRGNIYSTFLSKLSVFTIPSVARMTSGSDINLEDIGFGEKPYAIFIGLPDYDKSKNVIASLFIRQVYFVNARRATNERGQRMKREIVHILNEFGNSPAIEDMATMWTVGLSRGFKYTIFIHSFQQLKEIYKDAANIILDNVGNLIYILASSKDTNEEISRMLGNKTTTDLARIGEKFKLVKSLTETQTGQPLLYPAELARFEDGENVVIRTTKRKDLEGNPIKKYPIHNCSETETRFPYWYEYQTELNTEKAITDFDLPDLSNIDLDTRTLDIKVVIEWIHKRKENQLNNILKGDFKRRVKEIEAQKLSDLPHWKIIQKCLEKNNIQDFDGKSSVIKFIDFMQTQGEMNFSEADYELIKAMLGRQI